MAKKLDRRDFNKAAEYIWDEYDRRSRDRRDTEKVWDEVDRQLRMEPKKLEREGTDWFPEVEPAEQATALEVLTADARRLMFPDDQNWFSVHALADDDTLATLENKPLIAGDNEGVLANIDQDDVNAIVAATVAHNLRKYDFKGVFDELNAEAFRYGTWASRLVVGRFEVISDTQRGRTRNSDKFPALVPSTMRNTYLDDTPHKLLHEGMVVQPSTVRHYRQSLKDLEKAAQKGGADPTSATGGWLKQAVKDLEPDKKHDRELEMAEFEGDLLIERATETVFLPNVITTVAKGRKGPVVVRYRENPYPFHQTITQPYHKERTGDPYASSPLMKGMPIQTAMAEALNRLLQAMILNTEPPGNYDPGDYALVSQGGPIIEPRRMHAALTEPNFWDIGDVTSLRDAYLLFLKQYEELTGISAPRTGQQTKSHQTAFAVDQEMTRAQVRTVDYVKATMEGGLKDFLYRLYHILRTEMKEEPVFVPDYGYIKVSKDILPRDVVFRVHGASGPLEEREKLAQKQQAFQSVLQLEPLAQEAGAKPLDIDRIRQEILRDAGIESPERYLGQSAAGSAGSIERVAGVQNVRDLA